VRKPSTEAAKARARWFILLASASSLLAILWSSNTLVALFTPLYTVKGDAVNATLAMTYYAISFMGHRIRHPLMEALRVQLFPLAAGSLLIALASVAAFFTAVRSLQRGGAGAKTAANIDLIVALLALVSIGPLVGSTRIVKTALADTVAAVRYTTNAGLIVLGSVSVEKGPAYTAASSHTVLPLTLSLLATALAAAAAAPEEEKAPEARRQRTEAGD